MRPTKLGLRAAAFYGLLCFSFYAAPYLNLFFLLLVFLTVLGVLGLYWALVNLLGLKCTILEPQPFPAGASAVMHATVHGGRRKRHDLRFDLRIGRARTPHTAGRVPCTAGTANVEGTYPPLHRGIHEITRAVVSSAYPFGLVRIREAVAAPTQLVVYPTPADLSNYRDRHELMTALGEQGGHAALEMGPAGLREYKPGDELRQVHWKATARRRDLVVKEYEGDSQPGLEVSLDLRCSQEQLEASLSLIAGLALMAQDSKDLITLVTQDHRGTYGKGHRAMNELWTYLAEAQLLPGNAPPPPKASPAVMRLPGALEVAAR